MMSIRVLGVIGAGLVAMMGEAQASSIMRLEASTSTPSVIRLGAIEASAATPSIVALGDPEPAVTDEKVAAIPEKSRHGPAQIPMIIRGGIVGGAFATPAATASSKTATPAATPADGSTPAAATPPNGTAAAAPNSDSKATANSKTAANGEQQPPPASQKPSKLPANGKAM